MPRKWFTNKEPGQHSNKKWGVFRDPTNGVYYAKRQHSWNIKSAIETNFTSYASASKRADELNRDNGTD